MYSLFAAPRLNSQEHTHSMRILCLSKPQINSLTLPPNSLKKNLPVSNLPGCVEGAR